MGTRHSSIVDDLKELNEHLLKEYEFTKNIALQAELVNERLGLVLDTVNVQIWYLEEPGTYGLVNETHARFIGKSKEEIEFRPYAEVLTGRTRKSLCALSVRLYNSRKTVTEEYWLPDGGGVDRLLAITMTPVLDEASDVKYVVCMAEDITSKRRLEQEMLLSEKLKGAVEMSGAASHELNQPLQILLGNVELLMLKMDADDPRMKYVENIIREIQRMQETSKMIQNIAQYETQDYLDRKIIDIGKSSKMK